MLPEDNNSKHQNREPFIFSFFNCFINASLTSEDLYPEKVCHLNLFIYLISLILVSFIIIY